MAATPIPHVLTKARKCGATLNCFFVEKTLPKTHSVAYSIVPEYYIGFFQMKLFYFPVMVTNIFMTE